MKVDNKRQPMKASMLPGSIKGNMVGSGAETRPDGSGGVTGKKQPAFGTSNNPGAFVTLEAGADPNRTAEHDNGPRGDASATSFQVGDGQKKRTVTGVCQSPYDVK
jgi:hypothetical protein